MQASGTPADYARPYLWECISVQTAMQPGVDVDNWSSCLLRYPYVRSMRSPTNGMMESQVWSLHVTVEDGHIGISRKKNCFQMGKQRRIDMGMFLHNSSFSSAVSTLIRGKSKKNVDTDSVVCGHFEASGIGLSSASSSSDRDSLYSNDNIARQSLPGKVAM
ncbi:hypothetical protein P152DRAFT_451317 [Eremomyces bilateralis CBS 781.70]|uniref:Uncharacterized protein n=1 Tax=Eremomyces bilateralis CBS 781.70 TaxID=1392243 RepID=A0A6G1FX15_9PEZI|nr:uncharacterized protein P152DRAFT_451317 [Eremomyces bilateralis CBS 781.70]KAF1810220.1 hypothetical protein P152DRAFT_451317 [Eremomyces bilateralis CBS 781.70]